MDMQRLAQAIVAAAEVMARLRGPGGCPWDARQTEADLKAYLLEEAFEVADAVEQGTRTEVCAELGDLFFQIVFLARLGEEGQAFDLTDVIEGITRKMIGRHPHVFGATKVCDAEQVAVNWARLKEAERGPGAGPLAAVEGVPRNLPALMRAHRLTERADKLGVRPPLPGALAAVAQAVAVPAAGQVPGAAPDDGGADLGDMLFALANLAREKGFNAEDLLRVANERFLRRLRATVQVLEDRGTPLKEALPEQVAAAWAAAAWSR